MPRIFDNITEHLQDALTRTIENTERADFCVGYFNLSGWKTIASHIDRWSGGEDHCCRVLVGMQRSDEETQRLIHRLDRSGDEMDNQTAVRLRRKMAEEFRAQLTRMIPTNAEEAGLRQLARQLREQKVIVKLYLHHPLHAKLYLLHRRDYNNPIVGFLGSSNLTYSGLVNQGELNIDVLEQDAARKLAQWFEDRWTDRFCVDISSTLVDIIEQSWARETLIPPYHIYVKMAYHLSQEARAGLSEFRIPPELDRELLDFQKAAVKIAARHLNKRGGVLIGDVVGLGKTLMATALARIFELDQGVETLILCPKNLVSMWDDYRLRYHLTAQVLPISQVERELPNLRRFRLVLIDESHNLRNREGKRYKIIQEYVQKNDSRCILLSATPYNKTYLDLSAQLRLFLKEDQDLGVRPEKLLTAMTEVEFIRQHQAGLRTLAAFEKSSYADDWRELMRLFMVRRTRTFIQDNYSHTDAATGRKYLLLGDGATRSYFPTRVPRTVKFSIDESDPSDQYARLYAPDVVDVINTLNLPRYGLGAYLTRAASREATGEEKRLIDNLGRAGKRLMGFSRTNLFKRLESSGQVFIQSIQRHILRNLVFLYALEGGQPIPIGPQDIATLDAADAAARLDTRLSDIDVESGLSLPYEDEEPSESDDLSVEPWLARDDFERRARQVYAQYSGPLKTRFRWLRPSLFTRKLAADLRADALALLDVLRRCGSWDPARDTKLDALVELLRGRRPGEKVLVFTQFADTVDYLTAQLQAAGVQRVAGATGAADDPTALAWRFSPVSNGRRDRVRPEDELRVLVATDVLSEGQNLQDCAVVVNYDLPWAIIRLIQRAGRVDRIGQQAEDILCYSFLPAEGVERILRLRARVRQRLHENAEVVGADEAFFEDDRAEGIIYDLYNERAGILDGDADGEVDLASQAYQVWKNATDRDPTLKRKIEALDDVAHSTRAHSLHLGGPPGALVYLRAGDGADTLAWVDEQRRSVTESQFEILRAAACAPDEPALPRSEAHHALVETGVRLIADEERRVGGQLGRPSGARYRVYERLKRYTEQNPLLVSEGLKRAVQEVYDHPLRSGATDTLNRQLRSGINDIDLVDLVVSLRERDALTVEESATPTDSAPRIICSMGLLASREP